MTRLEEVVETAERVLSGAYFEAYPASEEHERTMIELANAVTILYSTCKANAKRGQSIAAPRSMW